MKFPANSPTFAIHFAGDRKDAPNKYSMVFLVVLLVIVDAAVLTWLHWRGYLSRSLFCVTKKKYRDSPCDEPLGHVEP